MSADTPTEADLYAASAADGDGDILPMKTNETRHSKDDALDARQFELLLEGAHRLRDPYNLQAKFVILVGGRLGLRPGEIAHLTEEWVNWRKSRIEIPRFEPCDNGRGGTVCGYCTNNAKQKAEVNEDVTLQEAIRYSWQPKTAAAARAVPFDFDARVEICIERFFERYDRYPHSKQSTNRRVKKAAEAADEIQPEEIYPHALRASAATYHAGRGLDILPLQALMGWAQASTAECYVSASPENTARALHMIHSR